MTIKHIVESDADEKAPSKSKTGSQKLIVSGGITRSGSTWLFNALRFMCEASEREYYSAWIKSYDPENSAPVHIVKSHSIYDLNLTNATTIATTRPLVESLASLGRMNWLEMEGPVLKNRLRFLAASDFEWRSKADYVVEYKNARTNPIDELKRIAETLRIELSDDQFEQVRTRLDDLGSKGSKKLEHDTQIHVSHRGSPENRDAFLLQTLKLLVPKHAEKFEKG